MYEKVIAMNSYIGVDILYCYHNWFVTFIHLCQKNYPLGIAFDYLCDMGDLMKRHRRVSVCFRGGIVCQKFRI